MDLTKLVDGIPELRERIGGVEVVFSEIPIEGLARLQAWINSHVPNPLEAIRDYLSKIPSDVASELADKARRESLVWPPKIGTAEGATALFSSTHGQVAAFHEGLKVNHADATFADAERLYMVLKREVAKSKDERRVKRIYATIFGTDVADENDGAPVLKNGRAPIAASTGA
jgi:hypothetical protein